MEIKYPADWGNVHTEIPPREIFFSTVKGPYLLGTGYLTSIVVPSVYKEINSTGYVAKVMWWDSLYNRTWFKLVDEISSKGNTRTVEELPNDRNYSEREKNGYGPSPYVFLSMDLRKINSPKHYLMVFGTEAKYINNGHICDLIEKSNQVSVPAPKFSILPSVNSSVIGPSEGKTIEVKVRSFMDVRSIVLLSANSTYFVNASFSPSRITIQPLGWADSELTIKGTGKATFEPASITQTIPISAEVRLPYGSFFNFNTNVLISTPAAAPKPEIVGLTITVFNLYDYIIHLINSLGSTINVVAVIAGLVGGVVGWFLKPRTSSKSTWGGL